MQEEVIAARFFVSGIVQGVGYRYFAQSAAMRLGVAGYVRNLRDGRVEVYAMAPPEVLRAFRAELASGPPGARVSHVDEQEALVDARRGGTFSIEYDE